VVTTPSNTQAVFIGEILVDEIDEAHAKLIADRIRAESK
jgi:hypothetical protein